MNSKNLYVEFGKFDRFNKLELINTVFLGIKKKIRKSGYIYHLSLYGAIGTKNKIYPMRLEVFSKILFTKEIIKSIINMVTIIRPTGYSIAKYVRKTLIPVITQYQIENVKGV